MVYESWFYQFITSIFVWSCLKIGLFASVVLMKLYNNDNVLTLKRKRLYCIFQTQLCCINEHHLRVKSLQANGDTTPAAMHSSIYYRNSDKEMSIHYKIVSLHINTEYKGRWENASFLSVKLLTMQRSVPLKRKSTQLNPPETKNTYIQNITKITISLFLQKHDFIIYFTARVVPLVQHI